MIRQNHISYGTYRKDKENFYRFRLPTFDFSFDFSVDSIDSAHPVDSIWCQRYLNLCDEFSELSLFLGGLSNECAVYFILKISLPELIAIVDTGVKRGRFEMLKLLDPYLKVIIKLVCGPICRFFSGAGSCNLFCLLKFALELALDFL